MLRLLRFYLLSFALFFAVSPAVASGYIEHTYKIGILAIQPKSNTAQRWSVLGDYLQKSIPRAEFVILPLDDVELEEAIQDHQLDFVLTNPEQYTRYQGLYGLSAPMATVLRGTMNHPLQAFGGTILTRAEMPINDLKDLKGRKIAVPFLAAFGAFKMQQYELFLKDLPLIQPMQVTETGLPHDNVIMAVLENRAEVGFVRAGTLERMVAQGKVERDRFKVINQQQLGEYPVMVSTHLYPEWPFAALSHIDQNIQGHVVAALLNMDKDGTDALPFNVLGFIPAVDYHSVETLMQDLRISPFDQVPRITIADIWNRYRAAIIIGFIATLLISLMGFYLFASRKKILNSQQQLKDILNSIDANVYVADMDSYQILFMNQHMIKEYGMDLRGERCWEKVREQSAPCEDCNNSLLFDPETGIPKGSDTWEAEFPNGRYYLMHTRAIRWHDGRLVRLQISTDITHIKTMEEELRQKQKMEALGVMAGGVAHNFNNCMAIILGNIELARLKQDEPEEWNKHLDSAEKALLRSRDLAHQVLTYSRARSNERKPICLSDFMKEVFALIKVVLPSEVLLLKQIEVDCGGSTILGDKSKIQEVLINLCNNAVQAMEGKGTLSIVLDKVNLIQHDIPSKYNCEPGIYARIRVSDTGCGIPDEVLDKIFDPFFTTKEVGQGTGLGLSTVQGTIIQHGGMIKVQSWPENGSTFDICFPLIQPVEERVEEIEECAFELQTDKRILFVDDDRALVQTGQLILTAGGYQVEYLTSPLKALEVFKEDPTRFDLLITDQVMPEMSGTQLIAELKKIRSDLSIMLYTGYITKVSDEIIEELGINAVCVKPIVAADMYKMVRELTRKS